jgi:hypothetical protein
VVEEPFFAVQAATEAGEAAVFADDPVAGNDDGDAVLAVGASYGPDSFFVAEENGLLLVRAGFAIGYLHQALPYTFLKWCAQQVQWKIEVFPRALEVLCYLRLQRIEMWMPARCKLIVGKGFYALHDGVYTAPVLEVEQANTFIGGANAHYANRSLYFSMADHLRWGVRRLYKVAACIDDQVDAIDLRCGIHEEEN